MDGTISFVTLIGERLQCRSFWQARPLMARYLQHEQKRVTLTHVICMHCKKSTRGTAVFSCCVTLLT
jgi:hypothetical protein